ncbi:MAG: hypothetical protein ACXWG1_17680 [Usitatibacter sp.]
MISTLRAVLLAACVLLAAWPARSETFFAASVRTHANAGANAAPGTLYTIDPSTAAATVVASIRLEGTEPIGIVGLAVHPTTGAFYGITGRNSPAAPHSLVKIDPTNGRATLVGPLGEVGSDVGFSPSGTLYTWLSERRMLGTIDLASGKATPIGSPGEGDAAVSGALAITSNEMGYVATGGAGGTLDRLDLRTGARTRGPALKGAPYAHAITNLSFSPWGKLFAVNADAGAPAETMLVTIDPDTGSVQSIGKLPTDIEALIFAPDRASPPPTKARWQWISAALALLTIAGILATLAITSRRSTRIPR